MATQFHRAMNLAAVVVTAPRAAGSPTVSVGPIPGYAPITGFPCLLSLIRSGFSGVLAILEATGGTAAELVLSGAVEGTADVALAVGDRLECRPTALYLSELQDAVRALEASGGGGGAVSSGPAGAVQWADGSGGFEGSSALSFAGDSLTVTAPGPDKHALLLRGVGGQYGDLLQAFDLGGNVAFSILAQGSFRTSGLFNEADSTVGVTFGLGPASGATPRAMFCNGTPSQNWEIDNDGGVFRWFTPGVERMKLDGGGNLILATGALLPCTLSDAQAPAGSVYFGSDHPDGSGAPRLCRKSAAGAVTVIG